jgi:DMSO/TMAO reductase YedYZ molybdopterin-dependent catalytic subunit
MLWRPGFLKKKEPSPNRLPEGQKLVKGWPVLHEGEEPTFDPSSWRLRIWGEVEQPVELDWEAFGALPRHATTQDFHCVTTWSRYDNRWEGVAIGTLLGLARPLPSAQFALLHCYDAIGYTTNLPFGDLARPENLVATHHDGAPLSRSHGGPVRMVVHHLFAWKSAKWLSGIQLLAEDQRGYWEERGYHKRGDPFLEERYSYQEDE